MIRIHTQLIGKPRTITDETGTWRSAIFRAPVDGPIPLGLRGLAGDQVGDKKHHGSPDQAVCCHPLAHYTHWNDHFELTAEDARRLGPGGVGENWTVDAAEEGDVCVGDIYQVGTAVVQISAPRFPCSKQERKVKLPGFLKATMQTGRTGWYVRVLQPGSVQAGDTLMLQERPQASLSVRIVNDNLFQRFEEDTARELLDVPELADGWKRIIAKRLKEPWPDA